MAPWPMRARLLAGLMLAAHGESDVARLSSSSARQINAK